MPHYSLMCLLKSNIPPMRIAATLKKVLQPVVDNGGFVRDVQNLGVRQLAYPINKNYEKHFSGHYFNLKMECSPTQLEDVQRQVAISDYIIRSMTIKEPLVLEPSPVKQKREKALMKQIINDSNAAEDASDTNK